MLTFAATTRTFTPLMIAAVLAWILCVCLHEFSHALVAYWGGDKSVREKGYLTLDPTRFIDPVFSLLIPAIVLLMGGLPLPGGAVAIDTSALKNRKWAQYVSAAGPASNLILFLLFCLPLHPRLGLADVYSAEQPTWVYFLGAMAVVNFFATLFNLIPLPPLDGYALIEHKLPPDLQWKMRQPQTAMICLAAVFFVFWQLPAAIRPFVWMLERVCDALGVPMGLLMDGYSVVLFDRAPGSA